MAQRSPRETAFSESATVGVVHSETCQFPSCDGGDICTSRAGSRVLLAFRLPNPPGVQDDPLAVGFRLSPECAFQIARSLIGLSLRASDIASANDNVSGDGFGT